MEIFFLLGKVPKTSRVLKLWGATTSTKIGECRWTWHIIFIFFIFSLFIYFIYFFFFWGGDMNFAYTKRWGEQYFTYFLFFLKGTLSQVQNSHYWYESSNLTCNLILNESPLSPLVILIFLPFGVVWVVTPNCRF